MSNIQQELEALRDELGAESLTVAIHEGFGVLHIGGVVDRIDSLFFGMLGHPETLDEVVSELRAKVSNDG